MTDHQTHLTRPKYRPDIDGLRAIAVLSVVAFHAFPSWVRGGFIGVDVFFVISGYLISTIIFENLDKGTFSFSEFYSRRIRRIFPTLLLVQIACFAFGWVALLADEYKQLGKHIAASAGFISNFTLWNEAGYFDNSAETKPLLHLWSLGIEEQFYIVWPLLLWFAWKHKFNLLTITLVVAIASFVLNIKGIKHDMVATFYSPQTRFWELLSGSLLAWFTLYEKDAFTDIKTKIEVWFSRVVYSEKLEGDGKTLANIISFSGLFLLLYGFWRINKDFSFPGTWALVPVLGAVLIITADSKAWVNRIILSNKIAVWFGLISFPLYLWHWPILSFARIIESEVPSRNIRIASVLLSIALAWLSYKIVERPLRFGNHSKVKVTVLVILIIIVGYIGYKTYESQGLPFREVVKINDSIGTGADGGVGVALIDDCGIALKDRDIQKKISVCASDSRGPLRYALIGDSKAPAIFGGLVRTSNDYGRWLFIGGNGPNGAPVPVISNSDIYKNYLPLSTVAVNSVASNKDIEKVVLVAATRALFQLSNDVDIEDLPTSKNYLFALEGLKNSVDILRSAGKKIILLVDNPTLPHPEDCLNLNRRISLGSSLLAEKNPKCVLSLDKHLSLSSKYRELLEEVKATYPNDVDVFDTTKYLCDMNKRECTHIKDGRFLYSYSDHISDYAAGLIGHDLNTFLNIK